MEIEHINDDTIRVKIDNSDLINRGVTFLDLLSNEKQIEHFFYSILEEVDLNDDFKDSDAVTFQVMPKNNGLELFISKGAKVDEDILGQFADLTDDKPKKEKNSILLDSSSNIAFDEPIEEDYSKIIRIDNIEKGILLASDIDNEGMDSSLYYQGNDYYLCIEFNEYDELTDANRELLMAKMLEYGDESQISVDVLEEYAKCVIEDNALGVLKTHFK